MVLLLSGCGGAAAPSPPASPPASPSGPAILAPAGPSSGNAVKGITCDGAEQVAFHIHAHLAVFVDGGARLIPAGIGIPPPQQVTETQAGPFVTGVSCFFWLHTHDLSGVIHIESPRPRAFTLGDFFDVWGQPLGLSEVATSKGAPVHAFLDGGLVNGDPHSIPLGPHSVIQLDVGDETPFQPYTFPQGL
jgi:hypothetical protein